MDYRSTVRRRGASEEIENKNSRYTETSNGCNERELYRNAAIGRLTPSQHSGLRWKDMFTLQYE